MSNSIYDNVELNEDVGFKMEVRDVTDIDDNEIPFDIDEPVNEEIIEEVIDEPVPIMETTITNTSSNNFIVKEEDEEEPKKTKSKKKSISSQLSSNNIDYNKLIQDDPNEEFIPGCFTNNQFNRFMLALNVLKSAGTEASIKNGIIKLESGPLRSLVYCNMHLPNASFDLPDITSNSKILTLFKNSDIVHFEEDNSVYIFYSGKNSIQIRKAMINSNYQSEALKNILDVVENMHNGSSQHLKMVEYNFTDEERKEVMSFASSCGESNLGIISTDNDKKIMFKCGDMNRGQLTFLSTELENSDLIKSHIKNKGSVFYNPLVDSAIDTTFMKWNFTRLKLSIFYNTKKTSNELYFPISGNIADCIDIVMLGKGFLNLSED